MLPAETSYGLEALDDTSAVSQDVIAVSEQFKQKYYTLKFGKDMHDTVFLRDVTKHYVRGIAIWL